MQTGGDADKDYYNDLPGKVPPDVIPSDVIPPPVPPLPASVPPFTTLPPVTPNLIDFNCDIASCDGPHHDYVNYNAAATREIDVFDMRKLSLF